MVARINKKQILCFLLSLCFLFILASMPFFSPSALAATPSQQRFGAWVAAAITALNINLQAQYAPVIDMVNTIADPFDVQYTYPDTYLNDYFEQSTIQIVENGTIIDGQYYDDVWLSSDAAEKFRVNANDWKTAYSIASNSNGTFAEGVGNYNGIPLFLVDGVNRSQKIPIVNANGQVTTVGNNSNFRSYYNSGWYCNYTDTNNDLRFNVGQYGGASSYFWFQNTPGQPYINLGYNYDPTVWTGYNSTRINNALADLTPFEFDYVSGVIPPDEVLTSNQGMRISIPHSNTHLQDFLQDNPEFTDPEGTVIDPSVDPDIFSKLDDLADIIAPIIPYIDAKFETLPSPVYEDTIANTDYNILDSALQNIINGLSNIFDAISSFPQTLSDLFDRILEDIEIGPIKVFDKILDILSNIFSPFFALIYSNLGIWHYVVSWFNSLSSVLSFMVSVLPSAIFAPVYALVAGTLCIAIFRRFGR